MTDTGADNRTIEELREAYHRAREHRREAVQKEAIALYWFQRAVDNEASNSQGTPGESGR